MGFSWEVVKSLPYLSSQYNGSIFLITWGFFLNFISRYPQ